ncbi:hypothetical protein AB0M68_37185 [Streptomyces sp. NPDC051453]
MSRIERQRPQPPGSSPAARAYEIHIEVRDLYEDTIAAVYGRYPKPEAS